MRTAERCLSLQIKGKRLLEMGKVKSPKKEALREDMMVICPAGFFP
jgi:hypothetical protein